MSLALVAYLSSANKSKVVKYSVVPRDTIEGEYKNNAEVFVKYGAKPYPARIERISGDKTFLNNLRVSKTGEIALSQKGVDQAKKKRKTDASSGISKKLKEQEKLENKVLSAVTTGMDKIIMSTAFLGEPSKRRATSSTTNRRSTRILPISESSEDSSVSSNESSAMQAKLQVPNGDSCFPAPTSVGCSEGLKPPSVGVPPRDETPTRDNRTITLLVTPEEYSFITGVLRNPATPKVTPANLLAVQQMAAFYESLYRAQAATMTAEEKKSEVQVASGDGPLFVDWNWIAENTSSRGVDKVELHPGSKVYIAAQEKHNLTDMYSSRPMDLARRLLKHLVGEDNLAGMSAMGTRIYKAIPGSILGAVKDHVYRGVEKALVPHTAFVSKVNTMCCNIRSQKGLSSKVPEPPSPLTVKGADRKRPGRKRKSDVIEKMTEPEPTPCTTLASLQDTEAVPPPHTTLAHQVTGNVGEGLDDTVPFVKTKAKLTVNIISEEDGGDDYYLNSSSNSDVDDTSLPPSNLTSPADFEEMPKIFGVDVPVSQSFAGFLQSSTDILNLDTQEM